MQPVRNIFGVALVALLTLSSTTAAAQDNWARPVQGVAEAIFGGQKLGVLLVTPVSDADTAAVESLIRQQLLASGYAAVVMDDAPLGDLSAKSDDEIIAIGKTYPFDVVVVLRTFPGADRPTAVLRVESTEAPGSRSFRLHPDQPPPPWRLEPKPDPTPHEDPAAEAESEAMASGRQNAAMTRMGALGVTETKRLISAEQARRVLAFEAHPKSPVVRNPAGELVPWLDAYRGMDRPDLATSYRKRSAWRVGAMAAGAVFGAAGVGMLFVGLANQANCGTDSGCGRPVLLIGGASSLVVGAVGIATGLLIRRHKTPTAELERLVETHNAAQD